MELDDGVLLFPAEVAALDVRAQVVDPAEAAALAAAEQARLLGQRAPVAVAVALDVRHQGPVLLRRPRTPLQPHLLAARSAPHAGAELQGGPCGPRTTLRSGQPRRIGTVGTGESACVPLSLLRSAFPPMPIASDCAPSFPCGCAVSHRILLCACGAAVGAGDVATTSTAIGHRQLHELQWKTQSSSSAGTRTSES